LEVFGHGSAWYLMSAGSASERKTSSCRFYR
jgi:hypothetical protein